LRLATISGDTSPRRRAFGACRSADAETATRKRKSASTEVITWTRLCVLTAFIVVAGGGVVALQRIAEREEAKVAPEAIGNAAIASVAPSATSTMNMAATPPASMQIAVDPPPAAAASAALTPANSSVAAVVAEIPKLNLRDAEPVFDSSAASQAPSGVTAFAAPDADVSVPPRDSSAMPESAPLPPLKRAALDNRPAAAAAEPEGEPEGDDTAASGADPIGTVTVRSAVTMREAPRRGGAVIQNLPGGTKVELVSCTAWCEIVADGKRGFVYKSFLDSRSVEQAEASGR